MIFTNMTTHPIRLFGESEEEPLLEIAPSGMTIRVDSTAGAQERVQGCPVPVESVTQFHGIQTVVENPVIKTYEHLFSGDGAPTTVTKTIDKERVTVPATAFDELPAPQEGVVYLVSLFAAQAAPRTDLWRPGTGPRDNKVVYPKGHESEGRTRGVRKLIRSC